MILHYITIALRNLERQKLSAFINMLGLSLGLACFSLFLLYAVNEFSYDRFHAQGANIYRVYDWWKFTDHEGFAPSGATPIGPALKNDLTDVENFVRIRDGGDQLIRIDGKMLSAKFMFADPQILSVFTFPLIAGDAAHALKDPTNIVLTRSKALQFFGRTDVIGKQIEIREGMQYMPFTVAAIAEDVPVNSTIKFEMLGSLDRILNTPMGQESSNSWTMTIGGISVYVLLRPGSSLMNETESLALFRQKYLPNEGADLKKEGLWNGKGNVPSGFGLQPLADVHTNKKIDEGASDPRKIWILIVISGGVLLIACINFIILSIGRSASRSKEVGVRKISGGRRNQLALQFLIESMLLTFFSALLGIGIAQILLPFFNELSGSTLTFSIQQYPEIIMLLLATVFVTGLLAGSYPALVLSRFKATEVLKNKIRFTGSNFFTRSLVTFQFTLSIVLIIGTAVILQQLSFMSSKDLGFQKENVVVVYAQGTDSYTKFQRLLEDHTAIAGISGSVMGMGAGGGQMGRAYDFEGKKEAVIEYPVDANFLDVMGMTLIAGRNFNPALTSDTISSVIVNEALVTNGLNTIPEKALGMQIQNARRDQTAKTIIGVVKDFHYEALTRNVRPQLFVLPADFKPSCFIVRLNPTHPKALDLLESTWKTIAPDLPFRYDFVDEKFDDFYKTEERWARILGWAGNLCIFLACLGLLGLASLSAVNRTKEVGIRKVLGASVVSIARLLCHDFIAMVILAIIIASPLAWYAMDRWLAQFAYKIELTWITFVLTGAVALIIAVLTVAFQAITAALENPVKSLRSE
jgi:putative ABC transport system permease protein